VLTLKRQQNQKQIWVTLSSFGNETHYGTKTTNLRVAYKTKCTLQQLLKPNLSMRDENKISSQWDLSVNMFRL